MKRILLVSLALALAGCYRYTPPGPPTPRPAVSVAAPFARTWDAVIDHFAERNISIATIERASGIVVASPLQLRGGWEYLRTLADCGSSTSDGTYLPTRVSFNVRVRDNGAESLMRVNANFESVTSSVNIFPCTTKGVLESELEATIREAAEKR